MDATHPRRWRIAAAVVAGATLVASSIGRPADAASPNGPAAQIEPTRQAIRTLDAAESRALLDLYAAEASLRQARLRAEVARRRSTAAREEVAVARRTLGSVRASETASQLQLQERLRALYRSGGVDTVAVLLTATSLDDALGRLDALRRLTHGDARLVGEMQAAAQGVGRRLADLSAARATLVAATEVADREEGRLSATARERHEVVTDLSARRRVATARLGALETAAREADRRAVEVSRLRAEAVRRQEAVAPAAEGDAPPAEAVEADPAPPPAAPPSDAAPTGTAFEVVATAYTLRGATATGVPTQRGVCAVDPAVIPLGTRFDVPGYGTCVAADTGVAVVGRRIDVWVRSAAEASAWGRRTVVVNLG